MRKYLPTLSELIDRLSIIQLKEVFITEHKEEYVQEISDICHDIDLCLKLRTNNWDLMVSCNSFVSHKCGKSRFKSKMNTNIPQSRKLLFSKWGNDLNKYNL